MILRPNFIPTWKYHTETLAYKAGILAGGGTISDRSLQHVDKFVRDCKETGVWSKLIEIMPLAGNELAAAKVKLKYQTAQNITFVNFVGADYTEATGLTGDGSLKYANLGYAANLLSTSSAHLSFYQRTDNAQTGNRSCVGVLNAGATNAWFLGSLNPSIQVDGRLGLLFTANSGAQMTKGFYHLDRSNSTTLTMFRNNAQIGTTGGDVSAATAPAIDFYGWAWNFNGTPGGYNSVSSSFISIGYTMTAQERADFYNIVQTLQANLGRAV